MQRYTRLPLTLYRIQANLPVRLRDYQTQMEKNRQSFDLKLHDGLVKPVPVGSQFETPNGMSLRPPTPVMQNILTAFRGNPTIYRFQQGMALPEPLVIYHEHTNQYSLQTSEAMPLDEFNERLTKLLQSLPAQTREDFFASLSTDEDDQDN